MYISIGACTTNLTQNRKEKSQKYFQLVQSINSTTFSNPKAIFEIANKESVLKRC